mgnify:CR=1 FL=1
MTMELIIGLAIVLAAFVILLKEPKLSAFVALCLISAAGYKFMFEEWRYTGDMTIIWLAGIAAVVFVIANAREILAKLSK